jgi:hypothetical protein
VVGRVRTRSPLLADCGDERTLPLQLKKGQSLDEITEEYLEKAGSVGEEDLPPIQTRDREDEGDEIVANSQVVLDGNLSKARLLALIALGREEEALDYKTSYDLSGKITKDRVEMVADVVAMANTSGGYIVLGVTENRSGGTVAYDPVGIPKEHLKSLDIDRLKPQIERYVSVSLPVRLQVHRLDDYGGQCFALIYVEESPEAPIIMEKQGQYHGEKNKSVEVFRAGDILARVGASTRRVDQNAMREQISKIRRRERDTWTEEILGVRELTTEMRQLGGDVRQLINILAQAFGEAAGAGSESASGPGPQRPLRDTQHLLMPYLGGGSGPARSSVRHDKTNYFLGASAFEGVVLEGLRAGDDISLMWYLNNATSAFYLALEEAAADSDNLSEANRIRDNKLEPLLDNLAVLAITCARYRRPQFLPNVRDTLYSIYERAHTTDFDRPALRVELRQSWVWEAVIKRVYAIGAALLWLGLFEEVPMFIRQRILWDDYWRDRFWARHALTMRAKDRGLTRQGLCAVTEDFIRRRGWFYRAFRENEDSVISALCQFDFLQCIHAINESGDEGAGYPSFGIYYNSRTEPILSRVIEDSQAREVLLPQMPDDRFAMIVKVLDQNAGREFMAFNGWDTNYWQDPRVRAFLDRYPDPVP